MSVQYDRYLEQHKANVKKGFEWLKEKRPMLVVDHENTGADFEWQICIAHDQSKSSPEEYDAYDKYFYGGNRSFSVVRDFNRAWLHHIHNNPHHWQHWVLINDDPKLGNTCIEMPRVYVIEMICDWWAFSWQKENLYEIFDWYEEHREHIELHHKTREFVEGILRGIKEKLMEEDGGATV